MTGLASIMNLTAVSVDRCIHIVCPLTYTKHIIRRRVLICIGVIWFLSASLSMVKGIHFHWEKPNYEMLISIFGFIMPLMIILFCYINIYQAARKQHKKCEEQQVCIRKRTTFKKDMKTVKTIALVVLAFFICWCPFFILNIYHGFCAECKIDTQFITFSKWLHYANSAINPVIYACFNKDYRQGFQNALKKRLAVHQRMVVENEARRRSCTIRRRVSEMSSVVDGDFCRRRSDMSSFNENFSLHHIRIRPKLYDTMGLNEDIISPDVAVSTADL